jgi:hypothetical protein
VDHTVPLARPCTVKHRQDEGQLLNAVYGREDGDEGGGELG